MDVQMKRVRFSDLEQKDEEGEESDQNLEENYTENLENYETADAGPTVEFSRWKEAVLSILSLFYVADIGLDMWVAARFFSFRRPMNAWFVIFCILLPNLYAGYKSLQWYLRAHEHHPISRPLPWMIRVSFFPISLLLRYYDTWKLGRNWRYAQKIHDRRAERRYFCAFLVEGAEAAMLRLFTIFLEDAPVAVLNLRQVILTPPEVLKHRLEMVLVVVFKLLFTMTLGVVHFLTSAKAMYHASNYNDNCRIGPQWLQTDYKDQWQDGGFLSLPAEICIYLWHLFGIGSKLIAYAMFASVHQRYLGILVGIRWILNTIWIKLDAWEFSFTYCIAFGGVYLFSFVPTSPHPQLLRVIFYYGITLTENVIIAIFFSSAMRRSSYDISGYSLIFGGAFASIVFMTVYYGFFHPRRAQLEANRWFRGRMGRSTGEI